MEIGLSAINGSQSHNLITILKRIENNKHIIFMNITANVHYFNANGWELIKDYCKKHFQLDICFIFSVLLNENKIV